MLPLYDLEIYLNELLSPKSYQDYCPNGLQIEGNPTIHTLVTGVSANQELINRAIDVGADAILVHHGFFWKNENPCVVGIKHKRLSSLLKNNISLFAYHLPLDVHPQFGNNSQLGKVLGFEFSYNFEVSPGLPILAMGHLISAMSGRELSQHIGRVLHRESLYIPGNSQYIKTVAWCTGAAQDYIEVAISLQADAYITGEISERTVSIARENGIHFFSAGHHATERYGVIALGEHLAEKFSIRHINIDVENPV